MIHPTYAVNLETIYPLANKYKNIGEVITMLLKNALLLAGLIFFFMLIFSGLQYILGGGNREHIQKAGATITNAILGLIIVFVSYWVIIIIEQLTGLHIRNYQ